LGSNGSDSWSSSGVLLQKSCPQQASPPVGILSWGYIPFSDDRVE